MRKLIIKIGGVVVVFILFSAIYPFVVGGDKMKEFCISPKENESIVELIKRSKVNDYKVLEDITNKVILVIDAAAMGRFICEVGIKENNISSYKYKLND